MGKKYGKRIKKKLSKRKMKMKMGVTDTRIDIRRSTFDIRHTCNWILLVWVLVCLELELMAKKNLFEFGEGGAVVNTILCGLKYIYVNECEYVLSVCVWCELYRHFTFHD